MSTYVNTRLPKICHAQPGRILRLPDEATGDVLPELFMLVVIGSDKPGRGKKAPFPPSAGLYNEQRELMLLSLTTGHVRRMPHLSSRADLTDLTLEDVRPDAATAPVLVSKLEDTQVRVTIATGHGNVQRHLNLGRPDDVMNLLQRLVENVDHVTEVKTIKQLNEEEEKARWRLAVGAGTTLLSFEDYRAQILD
ncbi:hypothetical protein G3A43_06935 [Paraburkholderia aspalathi]|nr:hypothetical protein [Paraburkholderia aspalathi]MBK3779986.1 hypothetical protein [Paraburkholderia aspalathi]